MSPIYAGRDHGSPMYSSSYFGGGGRACSPEYQFYRTDFPASIYIERPPSLDSESQMRIYEELEKEANMRKEKLKTQL